MMFYRFTSQFMSPLLAQHELKAIQERNYKSDNMQVTVHDVKYMGHLLLTVCL